jgi:hypothetical protein
LNVDRRGQAQLCIELMKECNTWGEISQASYDALVASVTAMKNAEYWSLRRQEPHAGKNESTDKQIAVSRVALPALEAALEALKTDDFNMAIEQLTLAVTTEGEAP